MTVVRAALVQASWTGDKESMIKAHEGYARDAAAQGAKVVCFQELFYGPFFCTGPGQASYYSYAESVPTARPIEPVPERSPAELGDGDGAA